MYRHYLGVNLEVWRVGRHGQVTGVGGMGAGARARDWWSGVGPKLDAQGADDASLTSAKTIAVDVGAS